MELCGYDSSSCTDGIGCCKMYNSECQGDTQVNYTINLCNSPNEKIITKSTNCSSYVGRSSGRPLVCGNLTSGSNQCEEGPCVPREEVISCNKEYNWYEKQICDYDKISWHTFVANSCPPGTTCQSGGQDISGAVYGYCR